MASSAGNNTSTAASSREDGAVEVTDAELIARMVDGDRSALSELYRRHSATLLSVSHYILRDRRDAEDVLHDVFLEAWRNCGSYSAKLASVRTWLVVRARSRSLDRLRANHRRNASASSAHSEAPVLEESREVVVPDERQRLLSALALVPEPQQGVIMLAYFEGLNTAEISDRLGIPAGTVKSRTHAALKTLRGVLGTRDG